MNGVDFVRTTYWYDSYTDYWRLVQLSHNHIISTAAMEPDNPARTYIITMLNGQWGDGWPDAKARIIFWNLEWLDDTPEIPGVSEVWASDKWYAEKTGARFVPLGSHPNLIKSNFREDDYSWDVAALAYMGPQRRNHIETKLKEAGITLAPNGWGIARDEILSRSRLMLNVHQHNRFPCVAAQRYAIAASAMVPMICEWTHDSTPFVPGKDYVVTTYDDIVETVQEYLDCDNSALVENMWYRGCEEYRFDLNIEKALEGELCESY